MSKLGRRARYSIALDDGREVGYSLKVRGGFFRVQFPHPAEAKHVEAATGVAVPKGWNKQKAPPTGLSSEAARVIKAVYTPVDVPKDKSDGSLATWEEAESYFMSFIKRSGSVRTYRSTFNILKAGFSELNGPAEVTPAHAERFIRKYALEPYRRSKAEDGQLRYRGGETVKTYLRNLTVIWKRLKKMRLVTENVWSEMERPKVPKKEPRIPDEDVFVYFFQWLDKRFPGPDCTGWPLLRTFIDVKSLMGCRLADLCHVETWQYDKAKKKLHITAEQDKTNQERSLRLPDDLAAEVEKCCGDKYLWQRYVIDSAIHRPGLRRATEFRPSVMYYAIQSIFKEFNQKHPEKKLKTHDFRRRAVTLMSKALGGDLDAVARALNITVETARKHYLDVSKVRDKEEIQKQMPDVLLVKRPSGDQPSEGKVGR